MSRYADVRICVNGRLAGRNAGVTDVSFGSWKSQKISHRLLAGRGGSTLKTFYCIALCALVWPLPNVCQSAVCCDWWGVWRRISLDAKLDALTHK
jgi:hypothetical protein